MLLLLTLLVLGMVWVASAIVDNKTSRESLYGETPGFFSSQTDSSLYGHCSLAREGTCWHPLPDAKRFQLMDAWPDPPFSLVPSDPCDGLTRQLTFRERSS